MEEICGYAFVLIFGIFSGCKCYVEVMKNVGGILSLFVFILCESRKMFTWFVCWKK